MHFFFMMQGVSKTGSYSPSASGGSSLEDLLLWRIFFGGSPLENLLWSPLEYGRQYPSINIAYHASQGTSQGTSKAVSKGVRHITPPKFHRTLDFGGSKLWAAPNVWFCGERESAVVGKDEAFGR